MLSSPLFMASQPRYERETVLLAQRFAVPAAPARISLINDTIRSLKTAGIWQKLDCLYVLASHDAQAARLNWIKGGSDLAVVGAPVFTTDKGYAGDRTSAELRALSLSGLKAVQDNITFGRYVRTAASFDGATSFFGIYTGNSRMARRSSVSGSVEYRVNDGTTTVTAVAAHTGHFAGRRIISTTKEIWRNGAQVSTAAVASTVNANDRVELFAAAGGSFGDEQLGFAYLGAGLDDTQMASMDTILVAGYLTSVGGM